jgi:hypothetical protein
MVHLSPERGEVNHAPHQTASAFFNALLDRAPCRVEGLKAANPGHGSLDPEMVALDPLLHLLP